MDHAGLTVRRARAGEIKSFTGIDDPYEPPLAPEMELRPDRMSAPECALAIVAELQRRGILPGDLGSRP